MRGRLLTRKPRRRPGLLCIPGSGHEKVNDRMVNSLTDLCAANYGNCRTVISGLPAMLPLMTVLATTQMEQTNATRYRIQCGRLNSSWMVLRAGRREEAGAHDRHGARLLVHQGDVPRQVRRGLRQGRLRRPHLR